MRRPLAPILLVCALAAAAPSLASPLTIASGELDLSRVVPNLTPNLTPPPIPLVAPLSVSVAADGSFTLPASAFGPSSLVLTPGLTTGLPPYSAVTLSGVGNGAIAFHGGAGTATGPLQGRVLLNVLNVVSLPIELSVVGVPGASAMTTTGSVTLTVFGQGWSSGTVAVTAVTTTTPGTAVLHTVTLAGSDARTASHRGSLTLVSGFRVVTNVAGNLPGFSTLTLEFVPEPTPGLLAAAGLVLLALGRRFGRR